MAEPKPDPLRDKKFAHSTKKLWAFIVVSALMALAGLWIAVDPHSQYKDEHRAAGVGALTGALTALAGLKVGE